MANWGIPWPDAQDLTVSFVPDGTQVEGMASTLTQTLGGSQNLASGEATILKALQTWAANSNINLGVVADGGEPLGIAGPAQGDARFGDIRIAAAPLPSGVAAITSPYDPAAGTLSGDVILNSNYDFNPKDAGSYDLFTVALHESGHVFGFADSTVPTSFMYNVYQGPKATLGTGAVAALQALYGGPRSIDSIDGNSVSSNPSKGVGLGSLSTTAPAVSADGDLATTTQADYYKFQAPSPTVAPLGFDVQVQTSGLSVLVPKVTVFDASGNVLTTSSASGALAGGTLVHLSVPVNSGNDVIEVQGATGDVFSIGSYQLSVMATGGTNVSTSTKSATKLSEASDYNGATPLSTSAQITQSNQFDLYSFQTPASTPNGLMVTVQDWGVGLALPAVAVYNSSGTQVGSAVASNSANPTVSVKLSSVAANATYYVRVTNSTLNSVSYGLYQLSVGFTSTAQAGNYLITTPWLGGKKGLSTQSNASLATAATLTTPSGLASGSHYFAIDGIGPSQTQQFFQFNTAMNKSGSPAYATISVQALDGGSLLPWISAFDPSNNALAPLVLTEQNGIEVVQIPLGSSGGGYSIEVSATGNATGSVVGNYILNVNFGTVLASNTPLGAGTLGAAAAGPAAVGQSASLTSVQGQFYSFVLLGAASNTGTDAILRMTLTDPSGKVVTTLTSPASQAASIVCCLASGKYTIYIDAYSPSGAAIPKLSYTLNGTNLTDPIRVMGSSSTSGGTIRY